MASSYQHHVTVDAAAALGSAHDEERVTRRRPTYTCTRCRVRRVKCDRAQPACSNCQKANLPCIQPQNPGNMPRGSMSHAQQQPRRTRRQELADSRTRLQKLEEVVERLAAEVERHQPGAHVDDIEGDRGQPDALRRSNSHREGAGGDAVGALGEELRGMIVSGPRSRYYSPLSWASVSEQIADIRQLLEQENNEPNATQPSQPSSFPENGTFPSMFTESSGSDIVSVPLPNESLSTVLVQLYISRVDPIVRLLHIPSFLNRLHVHQQMHRDVPPIHSMPVASISSENPLGTQPFAFGDNNNNFQGRTSSCASVSDNDQRNNRAFEALLFAVYYAAASSTTKDGGPLDAYAGMENSSHNLAARYKRGAELALEDADFVQSETLETLQAMVLLLSVTPRGSDPRTPWIRLGLVIRNAQAMGVHRDGSLYDLAPIETEVRRRIWAQICMLDLRAAEELGCEPTITEGSYDTCLPLSLNDLELSELEQHASAQNSQTHSSPSDPSAPHPPAPPQKPLEWGMAHRTLSLDITSAPYHHQNQSASKFSPFSDMTLSLVRFESVRLLQRLLCPKYQPEDSIFDSYSNPSSPTGPKRGASAHASPEKSVWVDRLEKRFDDVYKLHNLDKSDPMQSMTEKLATLLIGKARLIVDLQDWKEYYIDMTPGDREQKRDKLFQDASAILEQTVTLGDDPTYTNWLWYINTYTEVYASTFVLFNLARGGIPPESSERAWRAIDRLYTPATELILNRNHKSPLHRLLGLARLRRRERTKPVQEPMPNTLPDTQYNPNVEFVSGFNGDAFDGPPLPQADIIGELDMTMQDPFWLDQYSFEPVGNGSFFPWL